LSWLHFRIAVEEKAGTGGVLEVVGEAEVVGLKEDKGGDEDMEVMVDNGVELGIVLDGGSEVFGAEIVEPIDTVEGTLVFKGPLELGLEGVLDEVLSEATMLDLVNEEDVLEELLLATEGEDLNEPVELLVIILLEIALLDLVLLTLEVDVSVVFRHLMLCQSPLLSVCSYWEHGFMLAILTLWTYAVKGASVKSVRPPAHCAVAGCISGSPAHHRPR
jgi:hypothetical protein